MALFAHSNTTVRVNAETSRDVAALRNIVELAIQKWHESPAIPMRGNPGTKRAGLLVQDASDVEAALQELATAVGVGPVDLSPNMDAGLSSEPDVIVVVAGSFSACA